MLNVLIVLYKYFFISYFSHKKNFFLSIFNIIFNQFVYFSYFFIIISNTRSLNNWSHFELILLLGLYSLNKGIANLFTTSLYSIERYLKEDRFDILLIRPVSPIILLLGDHIEVGEFLNIFIGVSLIAASLPNSSVINLYFSLIIIILYCVISLLLLFSIRLICMTLSFWKFAGFPIAIALDNIADFSKYPIDIYNNLFRFIFINILPFSVLSYFPALAITKHHISYLVPSSAITVILLIFSLYLWNVGLSNYMTYY